ncbi:MAG: Sua5/YciO/YrdC/YwlC family protein, partial [Bdellovibrionales bacterium]|nr:Sua5/YciO/YrdC/YwlC family protein [Bdellovibrionales bacterium]
MNSFDQIRSHLESGLPILYPTETLWGLGVDVTNLQAVESLYKLKLRDNTKPMSILVKDIHQATQLVDCDPEALELMSLFWPGPVTFVLSDPDNKWGAVTASSKFVGLRCSA